MELEEHHRINGGTSFVGIALFAPVTDEGEIERTLKMAIEVINGSERLEGDGDRAVQVAALAGAEHGEEAFLWRGLSRSTAYGNLTYEEIRRRVEAGAIAIVPTGCTEQQGPHLPVNFDTWFAEQLMNAAAGQARQLYGVDALVLPALPFGPTPEHRNYGAGYIDIPVEIHHAMMWAILTSLADQGFQRILLWRGCGGHEFDDLVTRFNAAGRARISLPGHPFHALWCRIGNPSVPVGHADSFTTSICLYLRPDDVRRDRIVDPGKQSVNWDDENLDFARYSATGVIGDPTYASAELGKELWLAAVEAAASELGEFTRRS